ncbi:MAG TPA: hypothetical protein VEX11_03835 [Acetobacteraceae bacterium]|nr:hypothetical protein [Acetobacteraceae bacterium]
MSAPDAPPARVDVGGPASVVAGAPASGTAQAPASAARRSSAHGAEPTSAVQSPTLASRPQRAPRAATVPAISAAAPVPTPFVPTAPSVPLTQVTAAASERRTALVENATMPPKLGPVPGRPVGLDRPPAAMHAMRPLPPPRRVPLRPVMQRPRTNARPPVSDSIHPGVLGTASPAPSAPAAAPHAGTATATASEHAGVVAPQMAVLPAASVTEGQAPMASGSTGRPEPTRSAVLAAYRNAAPAAAPAPAPAPIAPAPMAPAAAPALAVARVAAPPRITQSPFNKRPTLARVQTGAPPAPQQQNGDAPQTPASPPAPDLDALADHVLERLRHELRDGRERLGFLLDDIR